MRAGIAISMQTAKRPSPAEKDAELNDRLLWTSCGWWTSRFVLLQPLLADNREHPSSLQTPRVLTFARGLLAAQAQPLGLPREGFNRGPAPHSRRDPVPSPALSVTAREDLVSGSGLQGPKRTKARDFPGQELFRAGFSMLSLSLVALSDRSGQWWNGMGLARP